MSTQKNSIGIDPEVVNAATADLPDEHRRAIRWAYNYAVTKGMSRKELADAIRYSDNTLLQIFTGSHSASKKNATEKILRFKELEESREGSQQLAFIETDLSRKIWTLCENALSYNRIGFIFGDSQIGKTENLIEYARTHNHGETIYIRMPEGGTMAHFIHELKLALNINEKSTLVDIKRKIIHHFDRHKLLIIDEAHQCFIQSPRSTSIKPIRVLEYIREIHDVTKCGVIISATNMFHDQLQNGANSKILEQLKRRRLAALHLDNKPTKRDLDAFAAAYGLPAATEEALELQTEVITEEALGFWLTILRMTAARLHRAGKKMTWSDVAKSHDMLRKLEN